VHGAPFHEHDRREDQRGAQPPARDEALAAEREREDQREHGFEREQQRDPSRREHLLRRDLAHGRDRAAGDREVREVAHARRTEQIRRRRSGRPRTA
jgi:hypothetical protein